MWSEQFIAEGQVAATGIGISLREVIAFRDECLLLESVKQDPVTVVHALPIRASHDISSPEKQNVLDRLAESQFSMTCNPASAMANETCGLNSILQQQRWEDDVRASRSLCNADAILLLWVWVGGLSDLTFSRCCPFFEMSDSYDTRTNIR
jgi:hypothetical protein